MERGILSPLLWNMVVDDLLDYTAKDILPGIRNGHYNFFALASSLQ